MTNMKNFEMTVEGQQILLTEKSHAGIFRSFFAHFLNEDVQKTAEAIESANIRTSTEEFFVAKNGSKKKNIFIQDGTWVYTHQTPAAMNKIYDKFLSAWAGELVILTNPAETIEVPEIAPEEIPEETPVEIETDPIMIAKNAISMEDYGVDFCDLLPSQKGKVTKTYNKSLEPVETEEDSLDL